MNKQVIVVDPLERMDIIKGLASEVRIRILKLLTRDGPRNVNELSEELDLPQSTVSSNVQILVDAGLVQTRSTKAKKGSQKICSSTFSELLIAFNDEASPRDSGAIEVAMPLGLYTSCEIVAPCGLCSSEGVIGLLDVPDTFLDPDRMRAGLLWFTHGFVEYQFPNNAKLAGMQPAALEVSMELSSEVPGTSADWPSDISIAINGKEIATWTSPGDFGDKRGTYTPDWWKLQGSQYGKLRTWRVTSEGTFSGNQKVSDVTLDDIEVNEHRSIRVRISVDDKAEHPGGVNIFGRGFGNHDKDIVLRLLPE